MVGALGVVDVVERIDLGLELGQCFGQWLLVEIAEQTNRRHAERGFFFGSTKARPAR